MANDSSYVVNHVKKRKSDLIKVFNSKCCLCGFDQFPQALEFHHVNPAEKSFGITDSGAATKALDKQLKELRKCVLVCANCHRGIHAGYLKVPDNYKQLFNEEVANQLLQELHDTKTHKNYYCKRCGKLIASRDADYCIECGHIVQRKILDRPTREELKNLIRTLPFTQIANRYGVSDNAIRKWCDAENLPSKKKDINAISPEEWEKI